jgi:hypothetical protein
MKIQSYIHSYRDTMFMQAPVIAGASPDTISNLTGWWKADAGVTHSSNVVSNWASQHGGTNNFTPLSYENLDQGGTYTTGGQNGMPYIQFDGVNDGMGSSANPIGLSDDCTILLVSGNTVNVHRGLDGDGNGWSIGIGAGGVGYVLVNGGATGYGIDHLSVGNTALGIYTLAIDQNSPTNTTGYFYDQYALQNSRTDNNYTLRSSGLNMVIGHSGAESGFTSGPIYELIIYNRLLTQAERESIIAYLKSRYAL